MATTYKDIQSALTGSLVTLNGSTLGNLPIAYYTRDFDPSSVTGGLFIAETYLYDQQDALTKQTLDEVRGIYQLTVYLKAGKAVNDINTVIDALITNYKHNDSIIANGQNIVIINAGRNGGRAVEGWFAVDVSINFKSDIPR